MANILIEYKICNNKKKNHVMNKEINKEHILNLIYIVVIHMKLNKTLLMNKR